MSSSSAQAEDLMQNGAQQGRTDAHDGGMKLRAVVPGSNFMSRLGNRA